MDSVNPHCPAFRFFSEATLFRIRPLTPDTIEILSGATAKEPPTWGESLVLSRWISGPWPGVIQEGDFGRYWWDREGENGMEASFRPAAEVRSQAGTWHWSVWQGADRWYGHHTDLDSARTLADRHLELASLFPGRDARYREADPDTLLSSERFFDGMRLPPWLRTRTSRVFVQRWTRPWVQDDPGLERDRGFRAPRLVFPGSNWRGMEIRATGTPDLVESWMLRFRIGSRRIEEHVASMEDAFSRADGICEEHGIGREAGL